GAHGVFIVYDTTSVESFDALTNWIEDIKDFADPTIVKILVGSKCDDTSNRNIPIEFGQNMSEKHGFPFIEVSSKTNVNINKLFYTMVSKLHKPQEQPMRNPQPTQNAIKLNKKNNTNNNWSPPESVPNILPPLKV
ncbi:Uncharacterized protein FWK35_00028111, partial [Aphis craccivora]